MLEFRFSATFDAMSLSIWLLTFVKILVLFYSVSSKKSKRKNPHALKCQLSIAFHILFVLYG
jgi:hypothetical protein